MHWNYRIIKHKENGRTYFSVGEVYYVDDVPCGYVIAKLKYMETLEDILGMVDMINADIKKSPFLTYPEDFRQLPL